MDDVSASPQSTSVRTISMDDLADEAPAAPVKMVPFKDGMRPATPPLGAQPPVRPLRAPQTEREHQAAAGKELLDGLLAGDPTRQGQLHQQIGSIPPPLQPPSITMRRNAQTGQVQPVSPAGPPFPTKLPPGPDEAAFQAWYAKIA